MLVSDIPGNMQVVIWQAKSVAWSHEWNELVLFNHLKTRYEFLLKQINNYQTVPQKAEPDSSYSHSSQLSHNCFYEGFSKAAPLISGILMPFLISVTLGLILDLEKSSLIASFWHQDEFFTYVAKLLFSMSTGFVEKMTVALLISLAAEPRGVSVSRAHMPWDLSPSLILMWSPSPVWLVCVALAELITVS